MSNWRDWAACLGADPEMFFPSKGKKTEDAQRICSGCPVRIQCLEDSLRLSNTAGIWAGLSDRQRRPMRRARTLVGDRA